ncbi:MAG TPA: Ig-like domain-containing protein [Gemmataceae bacterium]|nr:Ig-like domain-containing protein [Gemmataceae bacterium]
MFLFGSRKNKPSAHKAPPRVRLSLETLEERLVPTTTDATVVVPPTTTYNVAAGDTATLIADIEAANASGLATTINLTQSTYDFTSANNNTLGPNALPAITGNITINGNGAVLERDPSLGQNNAFRLLYVSGGEVATTKGGQSTGQPVGSLTLNNLTLEGGLAEGGSSGTGGGGLGAGGAIFNQGILSLNGVTVDQNTAKGGSSGNGLSTNGGTVAATAALPASTASIGTFGAGGNGVTATTNKEGVTYANGNGGAGGFGGGGGGGGGGTSYTSEGGTQTIKPGSGGFGAGSGTTKAGGGGLGAGGGIFNMYGTLTITNSTIAENIAEGGGNGATGDGGAIFNLDGVVNVISSTLAENEAVNGGAVYNLAYGTTTTTSSSGSSTTQGVSSTVTLTNSILADSIGGDDLVNDQKYSTTGSAVVNATEPNIVMTSSTIDDATTNGTPLTGNPELGPLTNNGGPTPTMALLSGSAALGVGGAAPVVPTSDQRGVSRGNVVDLGAYQGTPPETATTTTTVAITDSTTTSSGNPEDTITATITASDGAAAQGTVDFVDTTTNEDLGSATVTVVDGVAEASITTSNFSPGGDTIVATYTSSNDLAGSSGSVVASAGTPTQQWLNDVYMKLLGRPIDSTGLTQWGNDLAGGQSKTQVAYDIETSNEAEDYQINALFKDLFGVSAPSTALDYLQGLMSDGLTLQNIEAIVAGSTEYYAAAGGTNQDWLNAVYENFLLIPANDLATVSTSENTWLAMLNAGYTPTQVLTDIMDTEEYQTVMVTADYLTYLGVEPDSTSLSSFVSQLQSNNTTNAQIIATLLGSGTYAAETGTA